MTTRDNRLFPGRSRRRVHILLAFGTRPEVLKLYPVIQELRKYPLEFKVTVLATAQHRDLLDQSLALFKLRVHHDLNVMTSGQSLAGITARILGRINPVLDVEKPDMLVIQGDTTTTFSVALAAFYRGIPVGHVEAGLRTHVHSDPFPEEVNRQMTSVLATLHFAPTSLSRENLLKESIPQASIHVTGNTIVDVMRTIANGIKRRARKQSWAGSRPLPLVLVTTHRRESFGEPMRRVCQAVAELATRGGCNIVFPVHPNPQVRRMVKETLADAPNLRLCEPMDYKTFLQYMMDASLIITDSGGVQEEAGALGIPTLVTRATTERPEGITAGIATLVGSDSRRIIAESNAILLRANTRPLKRKGTRAYGDGHAAQRIVQVMRHFWGFLRSRPLDYRP